MTSATTAVATERKLGGKSIRWPDLVFLLLMYFAVLFTFAALLLLLTDIFTRGASVFVD
jgi:hypothetical protein